MIPKPLRDRVGLRPGEVEVSVDGAALRVEPVTGDELEEHGEWLVIPASGETLTVEEVSGMRDADQR